MIERVSINIMVETPLFISDFPRLAEAPKKQEARMMNTYPMVSRQSIFTGEGYQMRVRVSAYRSSIECPLQLQLQKLNVQMSKHL